MEKLDQGTYEEIKAGQIDGVDAKDLAEQLEIKIEQVEEVMRSGTWKQYNNGFTPKTTAPVIPKAAPSQSIRRMIGENYMENQERTEARDVLAMQVRGLMSTIRLLERRKLDLEHAIAAYDSYLLKALKILDIDQLEEGIVDFSRPNQ